MTGCIHSPTVYPCVACRAAHDLQDREARIREHKRKMNPQLKLELPPQPKFSDISTGNSMADGFRFTEALASWERVCKHLIDSRKSEL